MWSKLIFDDTVSLYGFDNNDGDTFDELLRRLISVLVLLSVFILVIFDIVFKSSPSNCRLFRYR